MAARCVLSCRQAGFALAWLSRASPARRCCYSRCRSCLHGSDTFSRWLPVNAQVCAEQAPHLDARSAELAARPLRLSLRLCRRQRLDAITARENGSLLLAARCATRALRSTAEATRAPGCFGGARRLAGGCAARYGGECAAKNSLSPAPILGSISSIQRSMNDVLLVPALHGLIRRCMRPILDIVFVRQAPEPYVVLWR